MSVTKVVEFVVDSEMPTRDHALATTILVASLAVENAHFLGIMEEDLLAVTDKLGTGRANTFKVLSELVRVGLVKHSLSQEGTAGLYAHRYKVNDETVRVQVVKPPVKS